MPLSVNANIGSVDEVHMKSINQRVLVRVTVQESESVADLQPAASMSVPDLHIAWSVTLQ